MHVEALAVRHDHELVAPAAREHVAESRRDAEPALRVNRVTVVPAKQLPPPGARRLLQLPLTPLHGISSHWLRYPRSPVETVSRKNSRNYKRNTILDVQQVVESRAGPTSGREEVRKTGLSEACRGGGGARDSGLSGAECSSGAPRAARRRSGGSRSFSGGGFERNSGGPGAALRGRGPARRPFHPPRFLSAARVRIATLGPTSPTSIWMPMEATAAGSVVASPAASK